MRRKSANGYVGIVKDARYVQTPGVGVGERRTDGGVGVHVGDVAADGVGVSVSVGAGGIAVAVKDAGALLGVSVARSGAVGATPQDMREMQSSMHSAADKARDFIGLMGRLYGLSRSVSTRFDNIGLQHL